MTSISDVVVLNVLDVLKYRNTKHGVCVSVADNEYLFINTNHREIYDDFEIQASDYEFLKTANRFVSCFKAYHFSPDKIIEKVGNLNRNDMLKIIDKVQKSKTINDMDKNSIITEITKWLSDNEAVS